MLDGKDQLHFHSFVITRDSGIVEQFYWQVSAEIPHQNATQ